MVGPHYLLSENWYLFFEEGKTGISELESQQAQMRVEKYIENKELNTGLYIECW